MAELINGTSSEDGPGYLYGYAIEAIFKDNSGNVFSLHQDK